MSGSPSASCSAFALELQGVSRRFDDVQGGGVHNIDLRIVPGEFVALVGASGSGKSTLLNLLGGLERPDAGICRVHGEDLTRLGPRALAEQRGRRFGFVFQAYHLIQGMSLVDNVALPGVYAGTASSQSRQRATRLLQSLGLGDRLHELPGRLSGGQCQRVAIARALLNDPPIVLADEPTGALDGHSAAEVLLLLERLHARGRTLVLVTHDPRVAARAERVIELHDGRIVRDERQRATRRTVAPEQRAAPAPRRGPALPAIAGMAQAALRAHRLRSALTALGIAIGVAAVLCMAAFSSGLRDEMVDNLRTLNRHHLGLRPNFDLSQPNWRSRKLTPDDAAAVRTVPGIADVSVSAVQERRARVRESALDTLDVYGVSANHFQVLQLQPLQGRLFTPQEEMRAEAVAVVDETVARQVGRSGTRLVGEVLLLDPLPVRIVGVVARNPSNVATVYLPFRTLMQRSRHQDSLQNIDLRLVEGVDFEKAEAAVRARLAARKRPDEVYYENNGKQRRVLERNSLLLNALIITIAAVSLVVAGIGVMNVMLISVTERTREIGLRLAIGARPSDVRNQFLCESTLLCLVGACAGAALAEAARHLLVLMLDSRRLELTAGELLLALGTTLVFGMAFGVLPAQLAARKVPARALAAS